MNLPEIKGPRDLPALRNWMERTYSTGGMLGWLPDADFVAATVGGVPLWWVEPEACELLAASAPTWPGDDVLTIGGLPSYTGLAVFGSDLVGTDSAPERDGGTVNVSAVMWALARLPPIDGTVRRSVSLLMFSRIDLGDRTHPMRELFELAYRPDQLQGQIWAFVGRTDWVDGFRADQPIPDIPQGMHPGALASMVEDRKLMASLWALASAPVVRMERFTPDRAERRRAERAGVDPTVRVMTLHGPSTTGGDEAGMGRDASRQWRHRWVVGPHFVRQAYGPGRSLRRVILRGPFWKGPPGAPIIGGDRVWKVVAPKPPERNE